MFSYFVFNGVNSRDRGIFLDAAPVLMRGKERVTDVTVLGRAGTLTLTEGSDIYEPYTVGVLMRAREPQGTLYKWLRGDGYITFSTEPERKQKCRVVNQTQFKRVSRNLNWYEGTVQFLCQPLKEALHEQSYALSAGATVRNTGDVTERPVLTLTGASGDVNVGFYQDGAIDVFTIADLDAAYGGVVIDSENRMVTSLDGSTLLTNLSSGEFPTIEPGAATLRISGSYGTVTIGRRERWL